MHHGRYERPQRGRRCRGRSARALANDIVCNIILSRDAFSWVPNQNLSVLLTDRSGRAHGMDGGLLRHARLLHLRDDKPAADVSRER